VRTLSTGFSQLLVGFWNNGWLVGWRVVSGESCPAYVRVCLSTASGSLTVGLVDRSALAQWYGTPLKSKYAARRKNRVAAGAENIVPS